MKLHRLVIPALAAAVLGLAGSAHAHENIFWSIGMSAPGMQVGVGNAPSVYVAPPVYMQPYPVVVAPQPVMYAPPVPVYYGPSGWRRHHREYGGYGYGYREHGGRWGDRD